MSELLEGAATIEGAATWDAESVEQSLEASLTQPEYHHLVREVTAPEMDWLRRLLRRFFSDREVPDVDPSGFQPPDLSVGFVAIVILMILFAIVAWLRSRSGLQTSSPSAPSVPSEALDSAQPLDHDLQEWLRRAREYAAAGDRASAIRCLLFGGMSWTERHGFVRDRPGLTNRAYLRALRSQPIEQEAFANIADVFERVYFGHRNPTEDLFHCCLHAFTRGFLRDDTSQNSRG